MDADKDEEDKKIREKDSSLKKFIDYNSVISIPSFIFKDRTLSVLEAITEYLKEKEKLTFHQIAVLIGRDDRTIWTCYNRAKKKRKESK